MNTTEKMLTLICDYLNNYFWRSKIEGTFTIENGSVSIPSLKENQYYRIVGSIFNEGIHKYPSSDLEDEEFEGQVWAMAIPQDIIALASDLDEWLTKYGDVGSEALSPFTSESFAGYSYSKNAGGSDASSATGSNSWQSVFASRLMPYRRTRGAS